MVQPMEQPIAPDEADNELMRRLETQQIPQEVLEELMMLAETQPDLFQELMQEYPQLAEMLQQDAMNMNGGQM